MVSIRNFLQILQYRQVKSKRIKNLYHANINQKKADLAILISDRGDFRAMNITRDREGHSITTMDLKG